MDLRLRLERIEALRKSAAKTDLEAARRTDPPLEEMVGGSWVVRDGLRCLAVEERYALEFRHGESPLREVLGVSGEVLQPYIASADARPLQVERAVFLDIETTGLARGAGTYAFLIGMGTFEGEEFVIRQFFMPDYGEEDALLDVVGDVLARAGGLVTFNGRSFDWPIVETRYLMARRQPPCAGLPHLDLLHLARRLWRRTLPSCALSSLERHVLCVERQANDVPGYLIPQLYQDYLHHGRTRPMADVFYHNLVDVLSLVALAGRAGRVIQEPFWACARGDGDPYSLGLLLEAEGREDEAVRAYQLAASWTGCAEHASGARKRLSFLYKRMGRYEEAMDLWWRMLADGELYPYVELAKQYEHRLKDYERARDVVRRAIAWVRSEGYPLGRSSARRAIRELEHRLERVERRLAAAP